MILSPSFTGKIIPLKFVIPNGSIVRNLLFLPRDDKSSS